jgi:hypothetical protein
MEIFRTGKLEDEEARSVQFFPIFLSQSLYFGQVRNVITNVHRATIEPQSETQAFNHF